MIAMRAFVRHNTLLYFAVAALVLCSYAGSAQKPAALALRTGQTAASVPTPNAGSDADSSDAEQPAVASAFTLRGLTSPATVAESIFVYAPGLPAHATVSYSIDGHRQARVSESPYWLGGESQSLPSGFSVNALSPGTHHLSAVARLPSGEFVSSNTIMLTVLASPNVSFSRSLTRYPNEPSAQFNSVQTLLRNTETPGVTLTGEERLTREKIVAMYANWGIDLSLDDGNDESQLLLSLAPHNWAPPHEHTSGAPLSMSFSADAPYYHAIPAHWPRVALPAGYFKQLQLNTNKQGDGIGFGEAVASPSDPELMVTSQWYSDARSRRSFPFPIPTHWPRDLPAQPAGDMHMIFIDPQNDTFVSSYKTSHDRVTGGPDALYAGPPTSTGGLGDRGGSIAAKFAELPAMLQPGEATDPGHRIGHALGGSIGRVWAARAFPASAWDGGLKSHVNTCTGNGYMNTGLVPYGGVMQLDPKLDLGEIKLTLPARRILEAIQTYGYYVMDFGCTDIDIYTAISEEELDPYGGLWGYNGKGVGVQNEVQKVLLSNTLYVVVPLTKKQ